MLSSCLGTPNLQIFFQIQTKNSNFAVKIHVLSKFLYTDFHNLHLLPSFFFLLNNQLSCLSSSSFFTKLQVPQRVAEAFWGELACCGIFLFLLLR